MHGERLHVFRVLRIAVVHSSSSLRPHPPVYSHLVHRGCLQGRTDCCNSGCGHITPCGWD